ncbi:hypothetical protein Bca52824_019497 [Brassica carinata]|uniref:Protein SDA1 n=1 Tax=Brassica carinata TaxID=52824 RepID=A0A8X8AYM2_BRACI|nr:hypothetical protein Bca52824_019497 [Brassica carinata]
MGRQLLKTELRTRRFQPLRLLLDHIYCRSSRGQQAALSFSSASSDPSVAKDLGDRAMFLAHVTPFYPKQLAEFPAQLTDLLRTSCLSIPSGLRNHVAQALILLMNRKSLVIEDLLALFLDVQTIGDINLRKLAFSHIVQTTRKMSVTDPRHKGLQKIVISMLEISFLPPDFVTLL